MGDSESFVGLAAQRRQIQELTATVEVLVDMLAHAFIVDREVLRTRVAERLDSLRTDPAPMPDPWTPTTHRPMPSLTGDPYRGSPREEAMATCEACSQVRPERLTVITAEGVICDVCAANRR